MPQHPCDGYFAGPAAIARSNLAKAFDKLEVLGQTRLAELRITAPKVVWWKRGRSLAGHRAGEQPGSHRSIRDHADSARWICAALKFETPIQRTLPSFLSAARVCQASSKPGPLSSGGQ